MVTSGWIDFVCIASQSLTITETTGMKGHFYLIQPVYSYLVSFAASEEAF